MQQSEPNPGRTASGTAPLLPGLFAELGQLGRAVRHLFGAQLHLLAAELGLAKAAVSWMLLAGLSATVAGVGLGLSLLAFVGLLLAKWFGSWILALLGLCALQILFLIGAILLFRRCMHWMSLPVTRSEWSTMMSDTMSKARQDLAAGKAQQLKENLEESLKKKPVEENRA